MAQGRAVAPQVVVEGRAVEEGCGGCQAGLVVEGWCEGGGSEGGGCAAEAEGGGSEGGGSEGGGCTAEAEGGEAGGWAVEEARAVEGAMKVWEGGAAMGAAVWEGGASDDSSCP